MGNEVEPHVERSDKLNPIVIDTPHLCSSGVSYSQAAEADVFRKLGRQRRPFAVSLSPAVRLPVLCSITYECYNIVIEGLCYVETFYFIATFAKFDTFRY